MRSTVRNTDKTIGDDPVDQPDQVKVHDMIQTRVSEHETPFATLLDHARSGEDRAWEALFNGLIGPILGYVQSRGAAEPEDLASEVFLQVARDIGGFEGDEASFRSWVFVIAHRRLIDSWRLAERRPSIIGPVSDEPTGGNVEEEAIQELALVHIQEIFDRLTENQRDVLALRVVADLSVEETARVLGKRPGAIKALQRRALVAVGRLITDDA